MAGRVDSLRARKVVGLPPVKTQAALHVTARQTFQDDHAPEKAIQKGVRYRNR